MQQHRCLLVWIFLQRKYLYVTLIVGASTIAIAISICGDYLHSYRPTIRNTSQAYDIIDSQEPSATFCSLYLNVHHKLTWSDIPTNFDDWTYRNKRKCPNFVIPSTAKGNRTQYYLDCSNTKPKLIPHVTNRTDDVQVLRLNNPCLAAFINNCCVDEREIPNILHYVWYFKKEMEFSMFLSLLSAMRYIKPCLILFHGQFLPYGKYWDYIVGIYPGIIHIKRTRPLYIFGKKIERHEHSGDIMRLEALVKLGGIYFDHDIIALRDLEPLRDYKVTLCNQSNGYLLNSFIMAKRNATFLQLWKDGYRTDYRTKNYGYNSMIYNNWLALKRPDLVHIEQGTLCSPTELINRNIMSRLTYDWSKLYGYHLHARTILFKWNESTIKTFNTTIGAMARHVLYGNKELCKGCDKVGLSRTYVLSK